MQTHARLMARLHGLDGAMVLPDSPPDDWREFCAEYEQAAGPVAEPPLFEVAACPRLLLSIRSLRIHGLGVQGLRPGAPRLMVR